MAKGRGTANSFMYPSGIRNSQPLVYGIVSQEGPEAANVSGSPTHASVNGGLMLVDTGSQMTILDLDIAVRAGLSSTEEIVAIQGVGGSRQGLQFDGNLWLPEFDLLLEAPFICYPMRRDFNIIGMDILSEFILTIHGPNGSINLARP